MSMKKLTLYFQPRQPVSFNSEQGFGIAQALIGMVIVSVMALGFADLMRGMSNGVAETRGGTEASDLQREVLEVLKSPKACAATFASVNFNKTSDIGEGAKTVPISVILQESSTSELKDFIRVPESGATPVVRAGMISKLIQADLQNFSIVDSVKGRYRAQLRLVVDKFDGRRTVRSLPIFIKGDPASSNVTIEKCSTSSSDWLGDEQIAEIQNEVCRNSGGTFDSKTSICTFEKIIEHEKTITQLETEIKEIRRMIASLPSPSASPEPSGGGGGGTPAPPAPKTSPLAGKECWKPIEWGANNIPSCGGMNCKENGPNIRNGREVSCKLVSQKPPSFTVYCAAEQRATYDSMGTCRL